MDEHHSWYNGLVWHIDWPYQVYVGQWPVFYGPAILLHILKIIWWRNAVLGIIDQCDSKIDLVKYMWVSDLYFMVPWFCLYHCYRRKSFLYIMKWCRPGVFMPLRALALVGLIVELTLIGCLLVKVIMCCLCAQLDNAGLLPLAISQWDSYWKCACLFVL